MAFIIIRNEKIAIQYTLVDFIEELTWEIRDSKENVWELIWEK